MQQFKKYKAKAYSVPYDGDAGVAKLNLQQKFICLGFFYYDGVNPLQACNTGYDFTNNLVKDKTEVYKRLALSENLLGLSSILPNVDLTDFEFPAGEYRITQAGAVTVVVFTLEEN